MKKVRTKKGSAEKCSDASGKFGARNKQQHRGGGGGAAGEGEGRAGGSFITFNGGKRAVGRKEAKHQKVVGLNPTMRHF